MQKSMVFIAGVLVGAAAVAAVTAVWSPEQVAVIQVAQPEPQQGASQASTAHPAAPVAGVGSDMKQPSGIQSPRSQNSSQHTDTGIVCPEPVEFTPAQLDELAEQRREQKYQQDLSNMYLSQPTAYAGKLLIFKDDTTYSVNVDEFAKAEAGGDWAERAQRVLQQYFDTNQTEFQNVLVECRATICRIEGKARVAEVFDRYFSSPADSFFPALGLSPFGMHAHVIPNDQDLGFVLFKHKNDDDFKQK